ncbi:hypothetical protein DB313_05145 (plasmid) [Borrelia turcica IST7]|uniref:Lipoprotein n=1 Tax=Borrelia turcica IST7 TaxID=1104446 RepID=A0A386PMX5_9SPIR|nr:hypothetical protein [Borrelia turcica]AYE36886.1 hypothetical protein DB313_05145 [Borrelia turcica IST7]
MSKGNMCIVILITTMFIVSCKLFESDDANKEHASGSDAASGTSGIGAVALGQYGSDDVENPLNDEPASDGSEGKKENSVAKLTQDDKEKLKAFFDKTMGYTDALYHYIYKLYKRAYSKLGVYSDCYVYEIECFSSGPTAERKAGLEELKKYKLKDEFEKLKEKLKGIASGYDPKILTDAIEKFTKAIEEAEKAEAKIETEDDYAKAKKADENKKRENVERLKTVKSASDFSAKAVDVAVVAYAEAFLSVVDTLSSGKFKEAVTEFTVAAKKFADGKKGDKSIFAIASAIAGMGSGNYEAAFTEARGYAAQVTGEEGNKLVTAIEKLSDTYKTVKP